MSALIKTQGIVLSHIKYGDGSLIVHIFTRDLGRRAYIVSGLNGPKRKALLPLLLPLSIVEITAYNKANSELNRIKEVHIHTPLSSLPFDPVRRTLAMFLTELLSKALKESGSDDSLYTFIERSVLALDAGLPGENSFHIFFMYRLTTLLGFEPDMTHAELPYFNMLEGVGCYNVPLHRHILSGNDKQLFVRLSNTTLDTLATERFTREEKHRLIEIMEEYYALHISGFGKLKSHEVLRTMYE